MTGHRAARVPKDIPGSGWYELLPKPEKPEALQGNITTDWLIIGAGFAGLSAAKRLLDLDPSAAVVVIDAQPVGFGASGRNSGFMIDLPHELQSHDYGAGAHSKLEIQQNREAIRFAKQTAEQFELQEHFQAIGKYHGAADKAGFAALEAFSSGLTTLNEDHNLLDADQMQSVCGSNYFTGGLYTPGCVLLQPAGYIRGFAEGLRKKHSALRIYENSPALTIETGTPHRVQTTQGAIQTNKIILTVNGHLESFGWHQRQLMHVFTYASMTRQLTKPEVKSLGGIEQWGLIPGHPMGTTVRRLLEDRIVIRNTFTFNPDMQTTDTYLQEVGRRHERSFKNRFPMLPAVTMEYCWGGHLCLSRNSVSVFGELEKSVYAACCHNGLGTTKGTLGGMSIIDLAAGQVNETVKQLQQQSEPTRLQPEPLMSLGANAYLKWQHWRAGRDL